MMKLQGLAVVAAGLLVCAQGFAANISGKVVDASGNLFIPNVTPDAGLSAPFNQWFTFFGQFFDHGLDLVTKGGSGTVFIPLQPDDPLITLGPDGVSIQGTMVKINSGGAAGSADAAARASPASPKAATLPDPDKDPLAS